MKYLVTGASGYIAMHVVDQLLKQGHYVRGTIRSLNDKNKVDALKKLGPVELVEAELLDADSWKKAVEGVDIVLHVASPLPVGPVTDENLIIKPAVEGTLNVMKASLEEGVKKVVVTSSGLTLFSLDMEPKIHSEKDWLPIEKAQFAYQKSKILAERAAWDFYEEHKKSGKCFDLTVVIPFWVLGPVLSASSGTSVTRFSRVFDKSVEKVENVATGVCDVRDVALAHIRASQLDEAVGQRIMIISSTRIIDTIEWTNILREAGYKVAQVENKIDTAKYEKVGFDNTKMRTILKMEPTDLKKTILDMTQSLIDYGIIKL